MQLAHTMIIPIDYAGEWFNPPGTKKYFTSIDEVFNALYSLFSWLGKSGLPVCSALSNYPAIRDPRLAYIEELIWEYYWLNSTKGDIELVSVTIRKSHLHVHYYTRGL